MKEIAKRLEQRFTKKAHAWLVDTGKARAVSRRADHPECSDIAGGARDRTPAPDLGLAVSTDVKHGPSVLYLFIDPREENLSAARGARECS